MLHRIVMNVTRIVKYVTSNCDECTRIVKYATSICDECYTDCEVYYIQKPPYKLKYYLHVMSNTI